MQKRIWGSFVIWFFVAAGSASCGGAQDGPAGGLDDTPASQDFSNYDPISLRGVRFEPKALFRQGMLEVTPNKKISIAQLRKKVKRRHSQVEVQVLTSMLWKEEDSPESATRSEALALLRAESQTVKKPDAVTLQMLAAAESWADNKDAWLAANQRLLKDFPKHKEAPRFRMWSGFVLLEAGKEQRAEELVEGWELSAAGPLGAYVIAWVHFRGQRFDQAVDAISFAAVNWKSELNGEIKRDVLLMLSRAGLSVADAEERIASLKSVDTEEWLRDLATGYTLAGYYGLAAAALERSAALGSDKPPSERILSRYMQAEYLFRKNEPAAAARVAIEAHADLGECKEDCSDKVRQQVTDRVQRLAGFFHSVFHATLDSQYYAPAESLYEHLIRQKVKKGSNKTKLANLKASKRDRLASEGLHPEETMYQLVLARREAIQACYERSLQSQPNLAGKIRLVLEVSDRGKIAESDTEVVVEEEPESEGNPREKTMVEEPEVVEKTATPEEIDANHEKLEEVAKCIDQRVEGWTFPGRSRAGATRVSVTYDMRPRGAK